SSFIYSNSLPSILAGIMHFSQNLQKKFAKNGRFSGKGTSGGLPRGNLFFLSVSKPISLVLQSPDRLYAKIAVYLNKR
ncbi:MAG: hypothetical protein II187_04865, partial [Treponema sp.]|nr:hypothetical protein [Treponema sp.]